jgi:hypothetical protein
MLPVLDDQYDVIVLCRRSLGDDLGYAVRHGSEPDEGRVRQFGDVATYEQNRLARSDE